MMTLYRRTSTFGAQSAPLRASDDGEWPSTRRRSADHKVFDGDEVLVRYANGTGNDAGKRLVSMLHRRGPQLPLWTVA